MAVGRQNIQILSKTWLSLHDLSTDHHLLSVSFITSLKSNLCTALSTHNTNRIISHAQNTTARQLNVFLAGMHRLLVTNKGGSAFPSTNNCQGQLQTPQSVSVATLSLRQILYFRHVLCFEVLRWMTSHRKRGRLWTFESHVHTCYITPWRKHKSAL
jgi:hypothetical protein